MDIRRTVLLADANEEFRALVRKIIDQTDEFAVVGSVGDGAEALRLARQEAPDLILMDVVLPGLDGLFAPFSYEGLAENAVRQLKFQGKTGRARSLAPYLAETLNGAQFDCIVPVPMYWKGLRKRGYNQAALLARFLGEETGMPVCPALRKCRDTAQQHTLHARERRKNLQGAYRVRKGISLKGKSLLLCDDVVTTGSTLLEAAQTLRDAGAARVYAVTVCKTVRRGDMPGEVG